MPCTQYYFHRPLNILLNSFFDQGFMLDRIMEPVFQDDIPGKFEWTNIPPVILFRLLNKSS